MKLYKIKETTYRNNTSIDNLSIQDIVFVKIWFWYDYFTEKTINDSNVIGENI